MQYKNLLASFKQLVDTEDQKYEKMWNLHLDELGQLTKQAILVDEIICNRVLGWDWKGPNVENMEQLLFTQKDLIDLKRAPNQIKLNKIKEEEQQLLKLKDVNISQDDGCEEGSRQGCYSILRGKGIENKQQSCNDTIMGNAHISAMIALLSQEASFLSNCSIEDDENNSIIPDAIENRLPDISPSARNILRALGILTENDIKVTM